MLRRCYVQPNNIGRLELKVRVVGGHIALDPMGLESGAPPHPRHHHMADAQMAGQFATTPVGGAVRRRSASPFQNLRLQRRGSFLHRPSTMARVQPGQPLSLEASLPATNIVGVATEQLANRQVGLCLAPTTRSAAPGAHPRPAGCASALYPSVPCAPSGPIQALHQACLMIHQCDTNVTVTGH